MKIETMERNLRRLCELLEVALAELASVAHTMKFEAQAVAAQEREITDYIARHVRALDLWDDHP